MRKKEKNNGLAGAKNKGRGGHPSGKKRKRIDYKGLKTGGWVAILRKKEKTNGLAGAINRGRAGQP